MHAATMMMQAVKLGQFQRALRHFEGLTSQEQDHPTILELAATLYGRTGDPEREVLLWQRLWAQCPADDRIGRQYATVLLNQGLAAKAAALLEALSPTQAGAVLLARAYVQLRRYPEAIGLLVEARARADVVEPILVLEAQARYRNDERQHARALLDQVAATDPHDGPTTRALGHIWHELLGIQQAIYWFERALVAQPDDVDTWEVLASCFEQIGAYARAQTLVNAIRERFGATVSLQCLELRLLRHRGAHDEARELGTQVLERPMTVAVRRAVLLELAQVEQRAGDSDRAFVWASEGNALAKAQLAQQGVRTGQFNQGLRRVLDLVRRPFAAAPARRSNRPAPVFLVGVPRSGTTLTQQMLQAHPALIGLDETDPATRALRRFCRGRPDVAQAPYPDRIARLTPDDWHRLRAAYWEEVAADGIDLERIDAGGRLLDKLPLSIVRLQWLARLFPDAQVIVCLRDPRDAAWSNFLQDYPLNAFAAEATDLDQIAELVDLVYQIWLAWRDTPPLSMVEVRYEALTDNPQVALTPVLDALELPFDEAVLSVARRRQARDSPTPSYHDVTRPIYGHARGRWRALQSHLAPIVGRLEAVSVALGYPSALTPGVG
ncbi:MAG: sulfotransferase [Myxococcota bacterium]